MNSSAQSNWKMQTLGDLGEVVSGGTPSRTVPSFWNGSIPWATPTDITRLQNKYILTTAEKITENGLAGSSAHLLPAGSLLVTSRATLGEAAIATVPIATNQGFKSIVPNAETHRVFAYYLVKTLKPKMLPLASGTTFLEIGKGDFCRIPVRIPDFDEQCRIAYVLDTIDEAIQKTEAVIAKLKQIRAGMLHDLLIYGLDKDGKLRDPIAHPEQFKDSELGRIPKEWEVVKCRSAFGLRSGVAKTQRELLKEGKGSVPVYGGNGVTGYTHSPLITSATVVIGRVGEYCGKVQLTPERAWITDNALYVTELTSACTMTFLHRYLDWRDLTKLQSATGQPLVTQSGIGETAIVLPRVDEQEAIVCALLSQDVTMRQEEVELGKLRHIKSGLMDDLLSGDVPLPEDLLPEGVPT